MLRFLNFPSMIQVVAGRSSEPFGLFLITICEQRDNFIFGNEYLDLNESICRVEHFSLNRPY